MELTPYFILKFLKFGIVGFSGVLIDFGITYLSKEKMRIPKYTANSAGFICAATSNYIFNRLWTFNSRHPQILTQYLTFFSIALLGLGISNVIILLLTDKKKVNFYLSKSIAVGTVMIWNFGLNYTYTFAETQ